MHSETHKKPKGPIDFSTLKYNQYYFPHEPDDLRLSSQKQPETKYKFELGGLLVYDSKATMIKGTDSSSTTMPEPHTFKGSYNKDLTKSAHSGNS